MVFDLIAFIVGKDVLAPDNLKVWLALLTAIFIGHFVLKWMENRQKNLPPGPTGLPFVGYLPFLGKEPYKTLNKLSKKYGNIFGLYMGSKYTIILNDFELMKEALTNPASLDRSPNIFRHLLLSGFLSANGEEWAEQRRFSIGTLKELGVGKGSWDSLVFEEIGSFVKDLDAHEGAPVDIDEALTASLSNNIMSLLIGRRLNKQTEEDKIQLCLDYPEAASKYTSPSNPATVIPILRKCFQYFKISGYDRAHKILYDFCQFAADEIRRHKTSPQFKNVTDYINTYLEQIDSLASNDKKNSKHYFSEAHLQGSVIILFLGASDTVVSSMGWALRMLAKHQDVQQKIYKELTEVLGENGRATYNERYLVPYTFAVLLELQRFGSIVRLGPTRRVNRDFEIRGYTIPKGAEIVTNLWAIHHDPKYWEDPEDFKPERFLTPNGKEILKQIPSFVPFSIGRRNCPGETFAWMEILAYLSEIVRKFHITTPPGKEPSFEEVRGIVVRVKSEPLCYIKRA